MIDSQLVTTDDFTGDSLNAASDYAPAGDIPADPATPEYANSGASLLAKPQITWNCTYRCSVYNTCMVKGAWNGDTSKCGAEPAGCQCVWGSL